MISLCSLFSGSSGNAILIQSEQTNILVDSGVSGKKLAASFAPLGLTPADLSGILVSHEHIDHTRGVGVLSRQGNIPVYASQGTFSGMQAVLGKIPDTNRRIIGAGVSFSIGDLTVTPFAIPHDAAEPTAFRISDGDMTVTVATDMGYMTRRLCRNIVGSDIVLLEANHDLNMLEAGPYPPALKARIRGEFGHLSNDTAAKTAVLLAKNGTKRILLGHLSDENNTPELAYTGVKRYLEHYGFQVGTDVTLKVAKRYERSPI